MVKKQVEEATPLAEGDVAEPVISKEEYENLLKDKQGLERAVSEKAEQVRRLEASQGDFRSEVKTLREEMTQQIQLIAMMQSEGRQAEEVDELSPKEKGDYLKRFQSWQTQQDAKRQQEEARKVGEQYRTRVEALGLTDGDDDYWVIYDHVSSGIPSRLKVADSKLKKLEEAKVKAEAEPKGKVFTEADLETEKRKWAEEHGLLVTDTGGPSGSGRTRQDAMKEYISGKITAEEAKKLGVTFD